MKESEIRIRLLSVLLLITFSFSCWKSNSDNVKSIKRIGKDKYLVKLELDSTFVKIYYLAKSELRELNKDDAYLLLQKSGALIKKEFFSKKDSLCFLIENYDIGYTGLKEEVDYYPIQKGGLKRIKIWDEEDGKTYFQEDYNEQGKIVDRSTNFYFEYYRLENDSICVKIRQPGAKYINASFQFHVDVNYSKEDIFELQDITVDSTAGEGIICFRSHNKVDTVRLVGNMFFRYDNGYIQMLELAKEIPLIEPSLIPVHHKKEK